jgi:uncharacterized protein YlxW (UPF0749 family)
MRESIGDELEDLRASIASVRESIGDELKDLRASIGSERKSVDDELKDLRNGIASVRESIVAVKVWGLGLGFTIAAGVFGTMARAFGWI